MEGVQRFLHTRARWVAGALAILFFGLTVYYVTAERFVASTVNMSRRHLATTLTEGDVIEQKVKFAQGDLAMEQAKIQVQIGTYQTQYYTGTVTVSLLDESGQAVLKQEKPCAQIMDNMYIGVDAENLQPDYVYTLRIELHGFEETSGALAVWTGEVKEQTENEAEQQEKSKLVGLATKNGEPLMDSDDEQLHVVVKGLETESGIQRAYYPLVALLIVGAIFFLLPSKQQANRKGEVQR